MDALQVICAVLRVNRKSNLNRDSSVRLTLYLQSIQFYRRLHLLFPFRFNKLLHSPRSFQFGLFPWETLNSGLICLDSSPHKRGFDLSGRGQVQQTLWQRASFRDSRRVIRANIPGKGVFVALEFLVLLQLASCMGTFVWSSECPQMYPKGLGVSSTRSLHTISCKYPSKRLLCQFFSTTL